MSDQQKLHRIFFALWPDEAIRQALAAVVKPCLAGHPAKKVPPHNWHLTLAFLGNVTQAQYECALQQAARVQGETFELVFDKFGYWSRPRVVWLGCNEVPVQLQTLVEQLNINLVPCEYRPEHRIYAPHLTLLRKANHDIKIGKVAPVNWRVKEFVLVESTMTDKGSVYQVIKRWPLAA